MAFTPQTINKELDMANLAKHNANYSAIKTELDAHDTHVADQTAHGSTAAATAGKIMQRDSAGRAKVAAPSASDDIARKAEADAVQANLDAHKADSIAHLSTSDREKLDGLGVGAEANQNAFAQVNNVVAGAESDTLTIAGGTGITVSTNPTTKTLTVTATGEATPGAHGSSHNNDGADPIPDLVALRDEFDALAGVGNTKTVREIADEVAEFNAQMADISYNVKAFGAVGDGVTDDTTAIKNAFAAVGAVGGRVLFPAGTYVYSGYIQPTSNITIEGVIGATVIKMKPSALPTFGFFNVGDISNVTVRCLKFVGNKVDPTTPGTSEPAMFFLGCSDILVENCIFTGYMGIGIAFQGGRNTKVIGCTFYDHGQNLSAWRGSAPKAVPAVWAAFGNEGLVVENCEFTDCRWSAVFMLGKQGSVDNCRINNVGESSIYSESSSEYPTEYNSATRNKISNSYMIDVTACGIEWATPNSVIAGNIISECGSDGIAVANCSYVTVENNIIFNCNKEEFVLGGGIGLALKDGLSLPKQGKGITINNNLCYDEQTVKTQKYGVYVTNYGGLGMFTDCSIVDNILIDNSISDLHIEGSVLSDASNKFIDNSWYYPDLLNGWVEFGSGYSVPGYTMDRGRVNLRGFIKNGTVDANTSLFVLPLGYRPQHILTAASISNEGGTPTPVTIEILTNGVVRIGAFPSGQNWLSLDNISFNI